jgi:hypothetical protein
VETVPREQEWVVTWVAKMAREWAAGSIQQWEKQSERA